MVYILLSSYIHAWLCLFLYIVFFGYEFAYPRIRLHWIPFYKYSFACLSVCMSQSVSLFIEGNSLSFSNLVAMSLTRKLSTEVFRDTSFLSQVSIKFNYVIVKSCI